MRFWSLFLIMGLIVACGGPPQKALDEAERAILDAEATSECAQEKFQAAQALLEEARDLSAQKKYAEAERKARAAERLANEAREEAELTWEECQRRQELLRQARRDPDTTSQQKPEPEEALSLQTIHFDYDSFEISETSREILRENARWIQQNQGYRIILEGHTDERGSSAYNLALGERRAMMVRQYLQQLGIPGERLQILSYGEEKPVAFGQTEMDFRQNRRVEFIPRSTQ